MKNSSTLNSSNGHDHDFKETLTSEMEREGNPIEVDPALKDAAGVTMFDLSGAEDNLITVLVKNDCLKLLASQSLVEIRSRSRDRGGDGRIYRGIVVAGPFYQPDGLRSDAPVIVTTAANGMTFIPKYHGRVQVEVMGELEDGTMVPPRFRPLPNSPVFPLGEAETEEVLNTTGNLTLGLAIGHNKLKVQLPTTSKQVLPRHIGILGTTGGGKSTTIAGLIHGMQKEEIATIIIDTEGEYTHINEPTRDPKMVRLLEKRGMSPAGVKWTQVLHPVGRETTNPTHKKLRAFSLSFDQISPYKVMEILELNEAQKDRYLKAFDLAMKVVVVLGLYGRNKEENRVITELDNMEIGFPQLTLSIMYDVLRVCGDLVAKEYKEEIPYPLQSKVLEENKAVLLSRIKQSPDLPKIASSWRAIQGKLSRLLRLGIFDNPQAERLNYDHLTHAGVVSVIDLSDTDSPAIKNLLIAELLRGLLEAQNVFYRNLAHREMKADRKVMVVIEEAHEFLSAGRIRQMPVLFEQLARVARRGRKRWLGLCFVTQLPQHLPDEVLTLVNSYILHKIGDANVISRLKRSIGGVDDSLWRRLTHLSSGQAIVTTPALKRPLLVAIDPTPCRLEMAD